MQLYKFLEYKYIINIDLLQRRLKLGYNRAGRIVDQLEAAGIIGPFEGSKAREVRCKDMASLEQLLKSVKSPSGV